MSEMYVRTAKNGKICWTSKIS